MQQYKPELNEKLLELGSKTKYSQAQVIIWSFANLYNLNGVIPIPEDFKPILEIPLFVDPYVDVEDKVTDWIDDYRLLFEQRKKGQGSKYKKETRSRMINFVKNNISYTTSEILEATKLYLRVTDPKFIQFPHYFIKKGVGNNATYNLQNWIEEYRRVKGEAEQAAALRTSNANTMK